MSPDDARAKIADLILGLEGDAAELEELARPLPMLARACMRGHARDLRRVAQNLRGDLDGRS